MRWLFITCGCLICFACACSRTTDESRAARRVPGARASGQADPAPLGDISVRAHGRPAPAITGARLAVLEPDFRGGDEQRAWRLTRLLRDQLRPGDVMVVSGGGGVSVTYRIPEGDGDLQPVLLLSSSGQAIVTQLDPDEPFPADHGRGGEPVQLRAVRSIDIVAIGAPRARAQPSPQRSEQKLVDVSRAALSQVEIVVDGARVDSRAAVAKLAPLSSPARSHHDRPMWSLRDLARAVAGPRARVTDVRGEGGQKASLSPADWSDSRRTLVARSNRRGQLKLQWIAGGEVEAPLLRGIDRIDIVLDQGSHREDP